MVHVNLYFKIRKNVENNNAREKEKRSYRVGNDYIEVDD